MKKKIGLLATARKKLDHPAPVTEFYNSPLFIKSLHYAKENYDYFYFYNAQNGLLLPDDIMTPNDISIKTFSITEKKEWGKNVIHRLRQMESPAHSIIYLHGGKLYRKFLEPHLIVYNYEYVVPLIGLNIGEQLLWYDQQLQN